MKQLINKLFKNRFFRTCCTDINYKTMQKLIKDNPKAVIIDVRTQDEYIYNHLKNAINIPLQEINERKVKQYISNKNSMIIVYCEYGGRSKKAVNKLLKMGYENIYNLDGGIAGITEKRAEQDQWGRRPMGT